MLPAMDERLRDLERAARARPDDRAAAWALVRALEQAGDRTGAWRSLCALARAGDDAAWDALDRRPAGLRRTPEVMAEARWPREALPALGAALEDALVLFDGHHAAALDPRDLTTRWRVSARSHRARPVALCGPVVACVCRRLGKGPELKIVDLASGALLGRASLGEAQDQELGVLVTADRIVARAADPLLLRERARVFDPDGRPTDVDHTIVLPRFADQAARGLLFASDRVGGTFSALPLDGGDAAWSGIGAIHGDDRGLLVDRAAPGGALELADLDLATGEARWSLRRDDREPWPVTGDTVLLASERSGLSLTALDRADGAERWRQTAGSGRCSVHDVVAARDVVYVVAAFTADERRFEASVLGFDLATGEPLLRHRLADEHTAPRLALVALEQGVAVIASRRDGTTVTRLA